MKKINFALVSFLSLMLLNGCVKDEKYEVAPTPVVEDKVVINEVYSRGTPEAPDWVEIYNHSDVQVDISGYKIYDSGGESGAKPKKEFPAGSVIQPQGFLVIVADDGTESGFGISSTGEQLWLANAAGEVVDQLTVTAMEETQSYGRYPDGDANVQLLNTITRGTSNSPGVAPEKIKINEIYSTGTAENPDWIEVYNAGTTAVDLAAYKIYDLGGQSGSKPKKVFPAGTSLAPGAFFVIVVDDADASGFGLSSNGEKVWLEKGDGTVTDSVEFPALEEGQSFGRYADGQPNLQVLFVPTPGAANDNSNPTPVANLKLNEVYSRGVETDPDWVEVFNAGTGSVDMSGWKIYDAGGQSGSKPKKEFPAGSVLAPGEWIIIVVDDADASGFGLSSNGEKIWLENSSSTLVDSVEFPALDENTSFGRYPDGTDNWQVLNVVTKGAANDNSTPPPAIIVKMNEMFSKGVETDPDWIEIYNASTVAVDLSGYKIYDSGGQSGSKPKKEFPAGTTIEAGGFFVIVVDDADASGFGLSSSGEEVWLEDASGAVIDNAVFPAMVDGQSYGRKPDGSDNMVIFTEITRGTSNNNAATLPKRK
ncbi:MAG: lamin tail domain-containing protein [Bacteroidales bacterium]|nr:lamin tail domain-containing protein [Bacteroidales bacterium]